MADYIHTYSEKEQERLFRQATILESIVFDYFDLSSFQNIIELGCGNGGNTNLILKKNKSAKITAIDISEKQIADAKQNLNHTNVTFEQGNILDLKYNENSFDCAFICWVLEHLENPQLAVNEAFRVLEPKGKILITEVFNQSLFFFPEKFEAINLYYKIFNDLQSSINGFPNIGVQLGNLLHDAGFKNIEISSDKILKDKRNIADRNAMMDYYIELILSAKATLIEKNLIDSSLILEVEKEKEAFKKDENSIFYYSPFQAIAEKF